jgi:hypothetical protein
VRARLKAGERASTGDSGFMVRSLSPGSPDQRTGFGAQRTEGTGVDAINARAASYNQNS